MGYLVLVVFAVVAYGWWRLSLRWWPYARCRWCRGRKGNNWGSSHGRWGDCPMCHGKGKRVRWGARA
jgi:hypothetical protein